MSGQDRHPRRPDASMDLLRQVREEALEPEYRTAPDRHGRGAPGVGSRRGVVATAVVLVLAGLMLGGAWRSTTAQAPQTSQERGDLITRIESLQSHQAEQSASIAAIQRRVGAMRASAAAGSTAASAVSSAEEAAGLTPVTGPGIEVSLADSPDGGSDGQIVDTDLRVLVNGLWQAGAQAVAVNGHRITAQTSIRGAGSAITVDYASITGPYTVLALGDPKVLPANLSQNSGGQWMSYLQDNFAVRYSVAARTSLTLPGNPRVAVSWASPR